jgi:hypothetical protein
MGVKLGGDRGARLTAKARAAGNAAQRARAQARAADLADTVKELQAAGSESLRAIAAWRLAAFLRPAVASGRPCRSLVRSSASIHRQRSGSAALSRQAWPALREEAMKAAHAFRSPRITLKFARRQSLHSSAAERTLKKTSQSQ